MIKRTLYFGNPAYLSMNNAQMVIKIPEVESAANVCEAIKKDAIRTMPIEDLGVVILDHKRITITQGLMEALLDNNCALITCDSTHMPTGLMLPLESHTVQSERFQNQVNASKPLRKQLWQQTVQAKITNQAAMLKKLVPNAVTSNMQAWVNEVRSDDVTNLEARAAAYYWKCFFPEVDHFVRHRELDSPNNYLNYGYAILRGVIARALVGSGLMPTLGIHHHNRYNAYCLADDMMEPYRPFVDELVKSIIRQYGVMENLPIDIKRKLLQIPTLDVVIDGKRRPLMVAASFTTASLAKCYAGESKQISYPKVPTWKE